MRTCHKSLLGGLIILAFALFPAGAFAQDSTLLGYGGGGGPTTVAPAAPTAPAPAPTAAPTPAPTQVQAPSQAPEHQVEAQEEQAPGVAEQQGAARGVGQQQQQQPAAAQFHRAQVQQGEQGAEQGAQRGEEGRNLPFTGFDLLMIFAVGLLLLGIGVSLRRFASANVRS